MLKLFGAGLTMFSCFAAGCLICAEMKKRIHTKIRFFSFLHLFLHMYQKI